MSKLIVAKDLVTEVDVDLDWYAFVTAPQKEYVAAHILRSRGIATFIPTETRWRSTNRYTKTRRLKEEMAFPVVPRCLFAGFSGAPPWYAISKITLILAVIGKKDRALRLNRFTFASFAASRANGSLRAPPEQRFMRTHEEFGVGDQVGVFSGPFQGHSVKVVDITGHMAKVLLPLFGSEREIDLPLAELGQVA